MTQLSEAIQTLKSNFIGDDGTTSLISDNDALSIMTQAVSRVNLDAPASYSISQSEFLPTLPAPHYVLLLSAASVIACDRFRAQAATRFKFTSGDKSVDRSAEANNWKWLREDLEKKYKEILARINPASAFDDVISVGVRPVRAEIHSHRGHEILEQDDE